MRTHFLLLVLLLAACQSTKDTKDNKDETLTASTIKPDKNWLGKWEREGSFSGADLEILEFKNDSIVFSMSASNGANIGEVEGLAKVKDNKAVYINKEFDDDCVIHFELQGDSVIMVDQKSGMCMAGMGVSYSGKYINEKLIKKVKEITLVEQGIFQTKEEEEVFKKLVGKAYELFVNSSQLVSEDTDYDSLNAEVYESGVRGLFIYMENIIMYNEDMNIWAAVIDDDKVNYYTNRKDYADKLPLTIEKWRERFEEKEVVYKSK